MGVDDLSPAASRLLNRAPARELAVIYEGAQRCLLDLFERGLLQPVQSWVNAKGETCESWNEADGDILECYRDMLGLNERTIVEYSTATAERARVKRRAQLLSEARG